MTTRIYITRDCLNAGITEDEILYEGSQLRGSACCKQGNYRPGDWHRTRADAIARAEAMRLDELERARAYVTKLEQLRFE